MNKKAFLSLFVLIVIISSSITFGDVEKFDVGPYTYLYYSDLSTLSIDGQISDDEYPTVIELYDQSRNFVNYLAWSHNNSHLAIALQSQGTGWLAIGFGPLGVSMSGADIVMGSVENEEFILQDMRSEGNSVPEVDKNSYIDMRFAQGREENGSTTIEFIIPMQSDDTEGNDIDWDVNGIFGFFTAYQEFDDQRFSKHTAHTKSHSVEILNSSIEAPLNLEMSLEVISNTNSSKIHLFVTIYDVTDKLDMVGLKIGIYEKSIFGRALLDILSLDSSGEASTELDMDPNEDLMLLAVLPASTIHIRVENLSVFSLGDIPVDTTIFEDIRDALGEHMVRDIMLTTFLLAILAVLFTYFIVFSDISKIRKGKPLVNEDSTRRRFLKYLGFAGVAFTLVSYRSVGRIMTNSITEGDRPYDLWRIEGTEWVMVIDLDSCDGCTDVGTPRCTQSCIDGHYTPDEHQYIKVLEMRDETNDTTTFFPRPCQQCRDPPCVSVCPVEAAWQRDGDRLTLIDTNRCIGCRMCMAACPYEVRFFNFEANPKADDIPFEEYYAEMPFSLVKEKGVVSKCEFCGLQFKGLLPHCVSACDEGAIYFGDSNENMVTNSKGYTVKLDKLLKDRLGYRWKEEEGTDTRVYYLPRRSIE